jgi:LysM repeat protein
MNNRTYRVVMVFTVLSLLAGLGSPVFGATGSEKQANDPVIHIVQWGESLALIARRYGVSITAIVQANSLANPDYIYAGQRLLIPSGTSPAIAPLAGQVTTYVVRSGDTLHVIAHRFATTVNAIVSLNRLLNPNFIYVGQQLQIPGQEAAVPPSDTCTHITYIVKQGDTLAKIALAYGTTVWAITIANNLANPSFIWVGQRLVIPGCPPGNRPAPTTRSPTPTRRPESTPTATTTPSDAPLMPTPTDMPGSLAPTQTPAGYAGPIKIEVRNYLAYQAELAGLGPFYVYGWAADARLSNFDSMIASLLPVCGDQAVERCWILFSSYDGFASKVNQIPPEISGVVYNSEPGMSADYADILLENENNSVVKFATLAEQHGLESYWGPLIRNIKPGYGEYVSDVALEIMFTAGLDGVLQQYQRLIDGACVDQLIYGEPPFRDAGGVLESLVDTATRLRAFKADAILMVQVMPGYGYSDGCHSGDAYAVANCGLDLAYTYQHCNNFAMELEGTGLYDVLASWTTPSDGAELVNLIRVLRGRSI